MQRVLARRVCLLALTHLLVFGLVFWLAFMLRFDFAVPPEDMAFLLMMLPWVLCVKLPVFFILGHYEGWWAHVTFADLVDLLRASLAALFLILAVEHFFFPGRSLPRAILPLDFLLTVAVLGTLRASVRLFREQVRPIFEESGSRWALLVGADLPTWILAHQMQSNAQLPYRIKGFLATDESTYHPRLTQIPVLGDLEDIREIAVAYQVTDILVTAGTLSGPRMRSLMDTCEGAGLSLKIIPPVEDRFEGDHRVPIRDIQINDLLQRDPVELDTATIGHLLKGRTVMVTGAGGSIGSEICRQVMRFQPRALILVGRGENRIFSIEKEFQGANERVALHACIADVTDVNRMRQVFEQYRPEVIFHAAAHKHVPLMENNVGEAIKNNVCGTKCVAKLADEYGVLKFVFISTDKAVHPSSIMGASKQLAERYIHALSQTSATRFSVVRFGNVLGSAGSVVPVFQEQIRRGGPITVTHSEMTRFFMTIPEASQLVLQAAAMGTGGEIFVLEMGEPVRIVDLARDLIRLSGLPENAIEIAFSGIRPGEKLYEELYFEDEETLPTSHPKLRAAYHRPYSLAEVCQAIGELEQLIHAPEEDLRQKIREIIPEYVSPSTDAENVVDNPDGGAAPAKAHR
ncbi:MAG TPA: nucleoside-diphosphate sugar epimerase/dehydratase [Thermoguttaceae bacterium]|nr:nucleoside-diphosphate sugar epimerase/dehydratase [Thermoguttaceae bacterium]